MQLLSHDSVAARVRAQLAVKAEGAELETDAAVAGLIRRAAGFLCPCSPRTLVDAVVQSSAAWLGEEPRDCVKEVLSQLITHGDLLESESQSGIEESSGPPQLYLAPPAFILRQSGRVFLHGIVPDHPTGLPDDLMRDVEESGIVRSLAPHAQDDWDDILLPLGFVRLSSDHWFGAPAPVSAREHVTRLSRSARERTSWR